MKLIVLLTNFLCSGTSLIVKNIFSKLMFATYKQVKSVCDLFISCISLVLVNSGKVSHEESDLTSFKGPKMCFSKHIVDQRRLTKTGLQQPFEYGQVSINKE